MEKIVSEPIEVSKLLRDSFEPINYSIVLEVFIPYIQYKISKIIDMCNRKKRLGSEFSIQDQEQSFLFELNRNKELLIDIVKNILLFGIENIQMDYRIETYTGYCIGDKNIVKELLTITYNIEYNKKEMFLELPFYFKLESDKGRY